MKDDRRHEIISRIVDGRAAETDWDALEAAAGAAPEVWKELALALRTEEQLRTAVGSELARADEVDLPPLHRAPRRAAWRSRRRGGLAAAALIVVVFGFLAGRWTGGREDAAAPDSAVTLDRYLETGVERGRIVRELPRVVVSSRPTEAGDEVEVLFVRRILERTVVSEIYEVGRDELGRPNPAPLQPAVLLSGTSY